MQKLKEKLVWLGPLLALILSAVLYTKGLKAEIIVVSAVTFLCAIWWIFEPIPIPVTSIIPLATFVVFGVLTPSEVASAYGHPLILLLLGGFILSQSMAYSGAHRRIALGMLNLFGSHSPRRLIMGFMAAAAVLSMWISNTATTLMLLPVALAILEGTDDKRLTSALLLAIAYSASIGGIGTPIGTPPNALFMSTYNEATNSNLGFIDWMQWGIPLVIVFIPIAMLWLTRGLPKTLTIQLPATGKWTPIEKRVMIVFAITALLWIFRTGPYGWAEFTGLKGANDASIALLACVALFIIPDGMNKTNKENSNPSNSGGKLLDWESANKIPWGVLLLFAGGICIAKAFGASGLSQAIGQALSDVTVLPIFFLLLAISISVTFLTEMTSNTATTALLMPILAAAALSAKIDPALLMVPAAMSASCAFMLPVATAPNAIVYGSEKIAIQQMVKTGFALNIIGAMLIASLCYFLI